MDSEKVKIHIYSINQDTTAIWKLEGCGNDDRWVCLLNDISDFKKFSIWNFSKVRIEFSDGRIRERTFYYDCIRNRLTQVDTDNLDFWIKESEDKTMKHNVIITKEENRMIEEYWTMLAMRKEQPVEPKQGWNAIFIGDIIGKSGFVKDKKELDHNPAFQEIAQFLSDTQADFVSVEHNYRFEPDLPFC